jgi:hypothetical protein
LPGTFQSPGAAGGDGRGGGSCGIDFLTASLPLAQFFHRSSDSHGAQPERESLAGVSSGAAMSFSTNMSFRQIWQNASSS